MDAFSTQVKQVYIQQVQTDHYHTATLIALINRYINAKFSCKSRFFNRKIRETGQSLNQYLHLRNVLVVSFKISSNEDSQYSDL